MMRHSYHQIATNEYCKAVLQFPVELFDRYVEDRAYLLAARGTNQDVETAEALHCVVLELHAKMLVA